MLSRLKASWVYGLEPQVEVDPGFLGVGREASELIIIPRSICGESIRSLSKCKVFSRYHTLRIA